MICQNSKGMFNNRKNLNSKIDKEILRIGFRIDPIFWFKKITKKVFLIG
jgi:hypothetical protein